MLETTAEVDLQAIQNAANEVRDAALLVGRRHLEVQVASKECDAALEAYREARRKYHTLIDEVIGPLPEPLVW